MLYEFEFAEHFGKVHLIMRGEGSLYSEIYTFLWKGLKNTTFDTCHHKENSPNPLSKSTFT